MYERRRLFGQYTITFDSIRSKSRYQMLHCDTCRCEEKFGPIDDGNFEKQVLRFTNDRTKTNLIVYGRFGQSVKDTYGIDMLRDSVHYSEVKEDDKCFEFTFDADSRLKSRPNLRYLIERMKGFQDWTGKVRLRLEKIRTPLHTCTDHIKRIASVDDGVDAADTAPGAVAEVAHVAAVAVADAMAQ